MISVRFCASAGSKIDGSRLRCDVPLLSAPNSSAAATVPLAVLRPSSATAIPRKPTSDAWMSFVASRNCQPRMSMPPARPAKIAADRHDLHVVARDVHAAVARGLGVEADGAHLVARGRAVQQHPEHDDDGERDEQADVQPLQVRVAPEHRQLRRLRDVAGDRHRRRLGVLQRAAEPEQPDADPDRDPVEHDRRDHLVGARRRLQQSGDAGPHRAAEAGEHEHQHDVQQVRHAAELRAEPDREDRADEVLALAADVEQAGAERERDGEADEDQRRRRDQRLLQVQRGGLRARRRRPTGRTSSGRCR